MINIQDKWESTKYPPVFDSVKSSFNTTTKQEIKKVTLDSQMNGKPCMILSNVLSMEECKLFIGAAEKIGFEEAETYCHFYRDRYNDRLMSDDPKFTDLIWERTKEFIPKTIKTKGGKWTLKGLNTRWRYCRYHKDHYFGAHTDGSYTPKSGETSFLTFMLYLNSPLHDDYTGGSTNFLTRDHKLKKEVVPDTGMALVFLQEDTDLLHEGAKLLSGTKHILRTDVMFTVEHWDDEEDKNELK